MPFPDAWALYDVIDATWPAAQRFSADGWTLRQSDGGGQRVMAATAETPGTVPDIDKGETAMATVGQDAIFMIRDGETALDQALAARGYRAVDPVVLYAMPLSGQGQGYIEDSYAYTIWPPLQIMRELWADGGIGPERLAVMDRAAKPKTGILVRNGQHPAGVAFVGITNEIAMIHAIEVAELQRRSGVGRKILDTAMGWAQDHGAQYFSLLVRDANLAANALYCSMGMSIVGRYHYRRV